MSKTKSQMNLLPVALLLILIVGAGYLLLNGEIKLPDFFNNEPRVRRLNGLPTVLYTSEEMDKTRVVIKSEEELQNYLQTVDKTGILQLQEKIDFNKEFLVAASTSTEPYTGSTLKIRKVYQDKEDKKLIVELRHTLKDEACPDLEKDPNIAVDMVALNKTDWGIEFELVKDKKECSEKDSSESTPSSSSDNK